MKCSARTSVRVLTGPEAQKDLQGALQARGLLYLHPLATSRKSCILEWGDAQPAVAPSKHPGSTGAQVYGRIAEMRCCWKNLYILPLNHPFSTHWATDGDGTLLPDQGGSAVVPEPPWPFGAMGKHEEK